MSEKCSEFNKVSCANKMSTLEDKLLGEKLEYYCSSSSDDEETEEASNQHQQNKTECKSGAQLEIGECPLGGYRYRRSCNTGPKGVVEDWQYFKKLQAEQREEKAKECIELAKKLTLTVSTAQEDEQRIQQEEIDVEFAELMSEEFLQEFQKRRIAEILKQQQQQTDSLKDGGQVVQLNSHQEFLDCIEKTIPFNTKVIIHIYDRSLNACKTLSECLKKLATDYGWVRFAQISIEVAGMSQEFRKNGLPALLVYQNSNLIGNFVRLSDELGDDFYASDLENFLIDQGILISNNLR